MSGGSSADWGAETDMTGHRLQEQHSPEEGLHVLKNHWTQKSYLEDYCRALTPDRLRAAIDATHREAPHRGELGYVNLRSGDNRCSLGAMAASSNERRLEAALFDWYGCPSSPEAPGLWKRLVAFQVPLYAARRRDRWGSIDLLGLTTSGEPTVIELKTGRSSETPLHALLQAATYATVLRANWAQLFSELATLPVVRGLNLLVHARPEQWPLILLAPCGYWDVWSTRTPKGRTVTPSGREAYRDLRARFAEQGLPVLQAEVTHSGPGRVVGLGAESLLVRLLASSWDDES